MNLYIYIYTHVIYIYIYAEREILYLSLSLYIYIYTYGYVYVFRKAMQRLRGGRGIHVKMLLALLFYYCYIITSIMFSCLNYMFIITGNHWKC